MTREIKKRSNGASSRRLSLILTIFAVLACCLTGISGTNRVEIFAPIEETSARIDEVISVPSEIKVSELAAPILEVREEDQADEAEDPSEPDEADTADGDDEAELAGGALVEQEDSAEQDESENQEDTELVLLESGYYRDDVPLPYDLQDSLHIACQEANIPYALALAVIERETCFLNVVGDDGESEGYMQVQRKWHYDRMSRLGVTDLLDPSGNFLVGCDFISELLGKYPTQEALTAYNSGRPGYSRYSYDVLENYEKWKELVGDDVSGIKS